VTPSHPTAPVIPSLLALSFVLTGGSAAGKPLPVHGGLTLTALKGLELDGWDGFLALAFSDSSGRTITLTEDLGVRLHRLPNYRPQWKIDQSLKFQTGIPYCQSCDLLFYGEAGQYRNQFASPHPTSSVSRESLPVEEAMKNLVLLPTAPGGESIRDGRISAGGRWKNHGLSVETLLGMQTDDRGYRSRSGLRGDFNASETSSGFGWSLNTWLADFPDGTDHELRARLGGDYPVQEAATDRFDVAYFSGRRMDVPVLGGGATHREDDRLSLTNQLEAAVFESMNLVWKSELSNQAARGIGGDPERRDREFTWKNGAELNWNNGRERLQFTAGMDVQQQKRADLLADGLRSRLNASLARLFSTKDSLDLRLGVIKYGYDTPSDADHNDRDELRYIIELGAGWAVAPAFGLRAALAADLNHIVYIRRARSAENRWTRLLGLYFTLPWKDPPVANTARFAVVSHYTDYDFEPYNETEGRVFRTAAATDTLRLELGRRWNCEIDLAGELNDHGAFVWDEWIQRTSEEGYAWTVGLLPGFDGRTMTFALGWIFHRRVSTLQEPSAGESGQSLRSDGPVARCSLRPMNRFAVEAAGTVLRIRDRGHHDYNLPDLRLTLHWLI